MIAAAVMTIFVACEIVVLAGQVLKEPPKRVLHRYTIGQKGTGQYKAEEYLRDNNCVRFQSVPKNREVILCGTYSIIQNLRPDEESEDEDQEPSDQP